MGPVWFSIKDPERIDSLDHTARPYSSDSFSRAHHGGSSWRLTPRSEGETWALSAGLFQGSFRALSGLFQGSFSRAHHGGSSWRLTPRSEGETWALSAGLFQGSFRALSGLFQQGSSRRLITEAHHGGSSRRLTPRSEGETWARLGTRSGERDRGQIWQTHSYLICLFTNTSRRAL
jgi:hypothetical protein